MSKNKNIRIVDIAKLAGVSAGTVDRVIHNRGYVSAEKRGKVEKILKEIDYRPNLVARFLASKRDYKFGIIVPSYGEGEYWELVCNGINKAETEMKKFNISVEFFHFDQYSQDSFTRAILKSKFEKLDGVVLATLFGNSVVGFSRELDKNKIPYVYLDSDIQGQNNLAYFGGDSHGSGQIAAKLLLKEVGLEADIFIAHIRFKRKDITLQMKNRERGFREYLANNNHKGNIHYIEIDPQNHTPSINKLNEVMHKKAGLVGGTVLNSRIYELVAMLDKVDPLLQERVRLVGHDAIDRNIKALKNDQISFILSQQPVMQGYDAIMALSNFSLFNQIPTGTTLMPIDILIKENIDYYNNYLQYEKQTI